MVSSWTLPKPWWGLAADDETTRLAPSPVDLQTDIRQSRCMSPPPRGADHPR
jgi:hypothetical protein